MSACQRVGVDGDARDADLLQGPVSLTYVCHVSQTLEYACWRDVGSSLTAAICHGSKLTTNVFHATMARYSTGANPFKEAARTLL